MLCINKVFVTGNVGKFETGQTSAGVKAGSILMAVDEGNNTVWVRVNVYGELAKICEERIKKGAYIFVEGKLMMRKSSEGKDLIEIRGHKILFPKQ